MRFAVIGSGSIVEKFLSAARLCPGFELYAVCSRTMERAKAFAEQVHAPKAFDSIEDLAACPDVEAVYVASPNYAHFAQSKKMLEAGKHVLCEKPLCSNAREAKELFAVADKHKVVLLEAMKPVFEPSFEVLKNALPRIGTLRKCRLSYCQYSSRYDRFKRGEILNAFNPQLSNAALMDIGVYPLHIAVFLFGKPKSVCASSVYLDNGFEGAGDLLLGYGAFQVAISYSKITDDAMPSEFQGENGSILVEKISVPQEITLKLRGQDEESLFTVKENQSMRFEAAFFMKAVENSLDLGKYRAASITTAEIMDEARRQTGNLFPADQQ